jgi:hypothetical protein
MMNLVAEEQVSIVEEHYPLPTDSFNCECSINKVWNSVFLFGVLSRFGAWVGLVAHVFYGVTYYRPLFR